MQSYYLKRLMGPGLCNKLGNAESGVPLTTPNHNLTVQ